MMATPKDGKGKDQLKPGSSTATVEPPASPPPAVPPSVPTTTYEEYVPPTKALYWIGAIPAGPMQTYATSHASFVGYTATKSTNIADGNVKMVERMGLVVEWSDDELKRVMRELGYERVFVTRSKKRTLIRPDGVRESMDVIQGGVKTLKDANGDDNKHLKHDETLIGSKPMSAYVYIVPIAKRSDQPYLEDYVNEEMIQEGEGLVWGDEKHWRMDKFPEPVGKPAQKA